MCECAHKLVGTSVEDTRDSLWRPGSDSGPGTPLAASRSATRRPSSYWSSAVLAHPSVLGDLHTIGPLGVVLRSWKSISRGAGEDLLWNGRDALAAPARVDPTCA